MKERIKSIRKTSGLNQTEFGSRIGISKNGVYKLESGETNPSEGTIRSICREFRIDRHWLETGEGSPKTNDSEDDDIIDEILSGENEYVKAIIRGIARTPGGWEKMLEVFSSIQRELDRLKEKNDQPSDETPPSPSNLRHIDGSSFAPGEEIPETIRHGIGDQPWDPEEDERMVKDVIDAVQTARDKKLNQSKRSNA